MSKFVIIDGNAIIHRGYHAIPPLTTHDGTQVNAVYGFATILLRVLKELSPEYIAVTFDVGGGTFRDEIFDKYKATRVKADQELYDQIPLVHDLVSAFQIPIFEKKGFEADDVIGTVVRELQKTEGPEIWIITGDMDTLQLVNDRVRVYTLRKGMSDVAIFTPKEVHDKFGFGPEHVVDYKALRGDTSDNIPGVPGIGEKTGVELIKKYGGIDDIYNFVEKKPDEAVKEIKPGVLKKLQEGKKSAYMSFELATINTHVPDLEFDLANTKFKKFDEEKLGELFKKFEFYSLVKRLNPKISDGAETKTISHKAVRKLGFEIVGENNFSEIFDKIKKSKVVGVRDMLSGPNMFVGQLIGFVLYANDFGAYFEKNKIGEKNWKKLMEYLVSPETALVGHDLKTVCRALISENTYPESKLFDVMVASYLVNSSTRAHDLPSIVLRESGRAISLNTDQTSLFGADPKMIATELMCATDASVSLEKKLRAESDFGLFEKVEMRLIPVLAQMEMNGVAVDEVALKKMSLEVAKEIEKLTKLIWKESETEFNVASPNQLRDVLFDKMKLPTDGIKRGKTGYSTADAELEKLAGLHPIISLIRDYRELAKLQNTYVDVLPTLVNSRTKRIHTTFNQAVTTTGRLSSSEPNMQNIPIRTELGKKIRDAFIAEPGHKLISADYSQIELRVVASLAEDEKMIDIFNKGEDIHRATAAAINGVRMEDVTKEMRYAAKEVNFGVLYGMGAYGLAWRAGISRNQAEEFIKKYFEQFSGVKKYIDQTLSFARKEGYVETLFGRRRYIPELNSDNHQMRATGERMAINMPIQGTAADLMKMAMIDVQEKIRRLKDCKIGDVRMTLQVHDELIVEVKNELADEVAKIVKTAMENVVKLRVPIDVGVGIGERWGEIK